MQMKFRVATKCQNEKCKAAYRSRAKEGREAPDRCKVCGSSKTMVHPTPEKSESFDIPMRFIPVSN